MQRLEFCAMGCQMLAVLDSELPPSPNVEREGAGEELAQVPGWFAEWERRLSRFREDSELSHLNRSSGRPVQVSAVLWEVIQTALQAARQSDGLVVPTLLAALEAAGYDRTFEALGRMGAQPLSAGLGRGGWAEGNNGDWRAIRCETQMRTITLPPGMRLDLGGIAKGWAADQAARRLGVYAPALMDAGGDIAVSGPRADGQGWPIGVADPADPEAQLELLLVDRGGVATSGRDYRRWQRDGVWQHHILDPRTGRPAETDVLSATVVAPAAREAEVAAKVALVLGRREGLAWLEARPSLAGLLVLENGRVVYSRRLRNYLWRP